MAVLIERKRLQNPMNKPVDAWYVLKRGELENTELLFFKCLGVTPVEVVDHKEIYEEP